MTLNTSLELSLLTQWDTPTICNALELIVPERRGYGFTVEHTVCLDPTLKPIVGYARTARCATRTRPEENAQTLAERRLAYYEYVAGAPQPTIAVIQDFETNPGAGAFWGEVNTNVHYGLGCLGIITNGCIRDIPDSQENFQMLAGMINPSHAWVHVVDWGTPVTIHGMDVEDGNLIHADMHGAVVIPSKFAKKVIEEAKIIAAKESILIQEPGFNMDRLREAWKGMDEIH